MSAAVSILIPYRPDNPHRTAIRTWQYGYLNTTYPHIPVIVASDGLTPDKPFNRSKALNRARAKATTDWLWVLDTDCAPQPGDLTHGLTTAHHHGWARIYASALQLDQIGTTYVLAGKTTPHSWNALTRRGHALGVPLIHADLWDSIGGWDEQYTGWGYEDCDMTARLIATTGTPPDPPLPDIRTLWHPRDYHARPTALNAERYTATHGR
jgi:hypothetical protein